jgi:hypothetical protein
MLNVRYHGCCTVAGVDVVLLDARIAPNGEEGSGRAEVADCRNAVNGWHIFVRHSLGAYIPRAGLAIGVSTLISRMEC